MHVPSVTGPADLRSAVQEYGLQLLGAFVPVALSHEEAHDKGVELALKTARLMHDAGFEDAFIVLADNNGTVDLRTRNAGRILPEIGEAGDFDTAVITLTFEDDTLAVIDNSRKAVYGYDQRLEVFGSKGMATTDNNFPNNHRLFTSEGILGDLPLHFFLERYQESYVKEMKAFAEALQPGNEMPVGAMDGLMSIAVGLAATKSAREKRPVRISEILKN